MQISIDGRLVPAERAGIATSDRGLTLGDGLFETLAVKEGRILRIETHLNRLREGLRVLRLPLPIRDLDLVTWLLSTVAVNQLVEGSVRLTVTRGQAARGLMPPPSPRPSVIISTSPWAERPTAISAVVVRSTRRNEHSPLSRIKSLGYLDNILALMEAGERGAQDAIMLNGAGRTVSASAANLFAVIDGELLTPPVEEGLLPGIVRGEILAHHGGSERLLWEADLARAEEIILTNSLGIRSVITLDGNAVGEGTPGPVAARIAAAIPFPGRS